MSPNSNFKERHENETKLNGKFGIVMNLFNMNNRDIFKKQVMQLPSGPHFRDLMDLMRFKSIKSHAFYGFNEFNEFKSSSAGPLGNYTKNLEDCFLGTMLIQNFSTNITKPPKKFLQKSFESLLSEA